MWIKRLTVTIRSKLMICITFVALDCFRASTWHTKSSGCGGLESAAEWTRFQEVITQAESEIRECFEAWWRSMTKHGLKHDSIMLQIMLQIHTRLHPQGKGGPKVPLCWIVLASFESGCTRILFLSPPKTGSQTVQMKHSKMSFREPGGRNRVKCLTPRLWARRTTDRQTDGQTDEHIIFEAHYTMGPSGNYLILK